MTLVDPWEALRRAEALTRAGDLPGAENSLRQLLLAHPNNAEALNALAGLAMARGRFDQATTLLGRALGAAPHAPVLYANMAEAQRRSGAPDKALDYAHKALNLQPGYPDALGIVALARADQGALLEALDAIDRAIAGNGARPDFYNTRGDVLRRLERLQEAEAAFNAALARDPRYADAYYNLAGVLVGLGRHSEAEAAARRSTMLSPHDIEKQLGLARTFAAQQNRSETRRVIDDILRQSPDHRETLLIRAKLALDEGDLRTAEVNTRKVLSLYGPAADALTQLGRILGAQGKFEEAIGAHHQAITLLPASWDEHFALGHTLAESGKFSEAERAFSECLRLRPERHIPYLSLSEVKRFKKDDALLAQMRRIPIETLPHHERVFLHFALAKALDEAGEFAEAADHMLRGNALQRSRMVYDEAASLEYFEQIKQAFDRDAIVSMSGGGSNTALPIVVFGMPRSGTSLVEQILSSHADVFGAGELGCLGQQTVSLRGKDGAGYPFCVRGLTPDQLVAFGDAYAAHLADLGGGSARVTDKALTNFLHVGLLHVSMPRAKLIHVSRNSADTCLSCFSKLFAYDQEYSYELTELARYYRGYQGLMQHWRGVLPADAFLDVRYEDVIADKEGQSRRLFEFCGLTWDSKILSFHETDRSVRTLSARQVRQPLYNSSVGRWRNYASMLAPLLAELDDSVET